MRRLVFLVFERDLHRSLGRYSSASLWRRSSRRCIQTCIFWLQLIHLADLRCSTRSLVEASSSKRLLNIPGYSGIGCVLSAPPRELAQVGSWYSRWQNRGFGLWGLTFELTGPQRQDDLARARKMYRVPQAGPRRPAVGGPVVQRGVRPHPPPLCKA